MTPAAKTGKVADRARKGRGTARAAGASALLNAITTAPEIAATTRLPLDSIDPDHWPNPRGDVDTQSEAFAELAGSIAELGMIEPIVVGGPVLDGGRHGILAGWRRYTAAQAAGLADVPVHVRLDVTDGKTALLVSAAENMAREKMTPLAEARVLERLMEFDMTQAAAAKALGVSERTARERLRLLKLPDPVRDAIGSGAVPFTAARQLQIIATAIAARLEQGTVNVDLLRDELGAATIVDHVARQERAAVVTCGRYLPAASLPLDARVVKKLSARARKAGGSDYVDLVVTGKLLKDADAAGAVLRLGAEARLVGASWIEKAATAAIVKAERAAARREREHAQRLSDNARADVADEHEQALRTRAEENRAVHEAARPFAQAMNDAIAAACESLGAVAIVGPVARLVLALITEGNVSWRVQRGLQQVLPGHPLATTKDGYVDDIGRCLSELEPEAGAALLVAGLVGYHCPDARARDADARSAIRRDSDEDLEALVFEAATDLGLLPERATRLRAACIAHAERTAHWQRDPDRRRIVAELIRADGEGVRDEIRAAAKEHAGSSRFAELDSVGAAVQVWGHRGFDEALGDLERDGVVQLDDETIRLLITGADALRAPRPVPPLFPDIDGQNESETGSC